LHGHEHFNVCAFAAMALGKLGPSTAPAVPLLTELLRDPDREVCWAGAVALGDLGPGAAFAVPELIELLRDERGHVRWTEAEVLGELGPVAASAVPELIKLLRDKEWPMRRAAAEAMGVLGRAGLASASVRSSVVTTIRDVIRLLDARHAAVRHAFANSVGRMMAQSVKVFYLQGCFGVATVEEFANAPNRPSR
jgi:HEAT repeat protein